MKSLYTVGHNLDTYKILFHYNEVYNSGWAFTLCNRCVILF